MADENLTPTVAAPDTTQSTSASAPVEHTAPVVTETTVTETVKTEISAADATVLGGEDAADSEVKVDVKTDTEVKSPEVKTDAQVKTEVKAPDVKTVEAETKNADGSEKKPEEKNKEEVSQSDEPAPLPSFEPWQFPEGVLADEAKVGEFNKLIGEFESTGKVDHALMQKFGQKLVDFNVGQMKILSEEIQKSYQEVWKKQTADWFQAFVQDPTLGGNKQDTTVKAARDFIRKHGGTTDQQNEIRTIMKTTGLGNHPALIRLFATANLNLAEGKPIPATTPVADKPTGLKAKMYGQKKK